MKIHYSTETAFKNACFQTTLYKNVYLGKILTGKILLCKYAKSHCAFSDYYSTNWKFCPQSTSTNALHN